jgi:hypothetical protein
VAKYAEDGLRSACIYQTSVRRNLYEMSKGKDGIRTNQMTSKDGMLNNVRSQPMIIQAEYELERQSNSRQIRRRLT